MNLIRGYQKCGKWIAGSFKVLGGMAMLSAGDWAMADSSDYLPFTFVNSSGESSSQTWIQFRGGTLDGYYIDSTGMQHDLDMTQSYSLDQLTNTSGASQIFVKGFASGRIYVNYGMYGLAGLDDLSYAPAAQTPTDPNFNSRYQYFEATVLNRVDGPEVYADLSYIDFTSISLSMEAVKNGTVNTAIPNYSQLSQNSNVLIAAALSSVPSGSQTNVIYPSGASSTTPNSTFTRVISPVFDPTGSYPSMEHYVDTLKTWSSSNTTLLSGDFGGNPSAAQTTSTIAQVYGYTVSYEAELPGGGTANGNSDGYIVLTAQSWSGTALNGGAGEPSGTKIYLGVNDLYGVTTEGSTGVYGNNPSYIVYNSTDGIVQSYQPLGNDVFGRVVGDLLAGMSLGYVASDYTLPNKLTVYNAAGQSVEYDTTKVGELPSTLWWAGGASSGTVVFYDINGNKYTADWGGSVAGTGLTYADVQPGSTTSAAMYNYYSAALEAVTNGYGFPLGDRLGENLLSFIRGAGHLGDGTDIRLTINPDGTQALTTYKWTGAADGDWDNGGNWTTNNGSSATPSSGATVQFGQSTETNVDTGTGAHDVAGIYFNYGAGAYTLQGGALNLSGNIINSSGTGSTQTIENDINLGSDSVVGAAFGDLVLSGDITLTDASDAHTMYVAGNGHQVTLSGTISDGATAGGKIIKSGTGTLELSGSGNNFAGGLDVLDGTVIIGADNAAGTGKLSLGTTSATAATTPVVTFNANGGVTRNLGNQVDINGNVIFGAEAPGSGFVFNGDVALAGASTAPLNTRTLTVDTDVAFNGGLSGSSAYALVKDGAGTLTLGGTGSNTIAAPITVNNGGLVLDKAGGNAYTGNLTVGDGQGAAGSAVVTVASGNQTPTSTSNTLTINADGELILAADTGVGGILLKGGNISQSGGTHTLTITDQATVTFVGNQGTSSTISSNVALASSTNPTTFDINSSGISGAELTISGGLSGSGINLTKTGNGELLLSGDNSGVTGASSTIAAVQGTLRTTSIASATVNVGQYGALGTLKDGLANNPSFNAVNSATGSSFAVELGDTIEAASSINLGTDNVFYFSGASAAAQTYDVMKLTGAGTASFNLGSLTFVSIDISGLSGTFQLDPMDGNTLQFVATTGNSASWAGAGGDGNWSTTANWQGASVPVAGSNITFSGAPTQTAVAIGSSNLNVGSLTFDAGSAAYTLGGSGGLLLNGDITNNATNTQTIQSDIYLTSNRSFTTGSGGVLSVDTVHLSYNGAVVGELTIDGAGDTEISGSITDSVNNLSTVGSVVKNGSGTLTFSNASIAQADTFSGQFTLNGGTVDIASSYALGDDSQATNIIAVDGGTIRIDSGSAVTFGTAGWTGRAIELGAGGVTFDIDNAGSALTINGTISGTGDLTKAGSGMLTLPNTPASSSANSYTGQTLVQEGTLVIGDVNALGSTSAGTTVSSGATLELNVTPPANASSTIVGEDFSIAGTGVGGNGAIYMSNQSAILSGEITLTGDALIKNGSTGVLQLTDINTGANTLTLETATGNLLNITGAIQGSGGLEITGPTTVTLSGSNSGFTGTTTVSSGILALASSTALGTASNLIVDSGAVLNLTGTSNMNLTFGSIQLAGNGIGTGSTNGAISNNSPADVVLNASGITLTGNASLTATSGTLTVNAPINMSTYDLTLNSSNVLDIAGAITGSGQLNVNAAGGGAAVLSGDNSAFTGTIDLTSGILTAAHNNALGGGSSNVGVTVATGTTLAFGLAGGSTDYTYANTGTVTIAGSGYVGGAIYNVSGNNTYNGVVEVGSAPATIAAAAGTTLTIDSLKSTSNYATISGGGEVYAKDLSDYSGSQILVAGGSTFSSGTVASPTSSSTNLLLGQVAAGVVPASVGSYSPGSMGTVVTSTFGNVILTADNTNALALSRFVMDLSDSGGDQVVAATFGALPDYLSFHFNYTATSPQNYVLLSSSTNFGGTPDVSKYTFTYEKGQSVSGTFVLTLNTLSFDVSTAPMVWNNSQANNSWTDGGNWIFNGSSGSTTGYTPSGGSAVAFTAAGGSESTPVAAITGTDQFVGNLTFQSGSSNIDVQGNTVHVHKGIANESTVLQTVSSDINITDDVDIEATSGDLALSGTMTVSNGNVRFAGDNDTTVGGGIVRGSSDTAVTKEGAGRLVLQGTSTYTGTTDVMGGTLVVNGTTATGNVVTVHNGAALAGSGTVGGEVVVGGTLAPGNSPGTLSTGSQQWLDGADYVWQVYDATGSAGTDWDSIDITGSLDLTSLGSGGFTLAIVSFSSISPDTAGAALNFNSSLAQSWNIVTTTDGIAGFDAADFVFNTSGFANTIDPGWGFSLEVQGNNLVLQYSAVPEPSTVWLFGLGVASLLGAARWRRERHG